MNKKIIISINPKYVKQILNGTKKYEYRRIMPKEKIDSLIIYEAYPVSKVVAEVEVKDIIKLPIDELWNKTKTLSGTTKEFFYDYFKDKDYACAYELGKVNIFDKPKELSDYGLKCAPQSFAYYNPEVNL